MPRQPQRITLTRTLQYLCPIHQISIIGPVKVKYDIARGITSSQLLQFFSSNERLSYLSVLHIFMNGPIQCRFSLLGGRFKKLGCLSVSNSPLPENEVGFRPIKHEQGTVASSTVTSYTIPSNTSIRQHPPDLIFDALGFNYTTPRHGGDPRSTSARHDRQADHVTVNFLGVDDSPSMALYNGTKREKLSPNQSVHHTFTPSTKCEQVSPQPISTSSNHKQQTYRNGE